MSYGLVILDPQYDYLAGGAIPAYNSTAALTNLAAVASGADLVVVTKDLHPENHFSFSDNPTYQDGSWPVHCVEGTKGCKIFPALRKKADYVLSKGMSVVPPDSYSAFQAKKLRPLEDLIDILARHELDSLVIGGFLLEIGVSCTAFDANALANTANRWHDVIIPLDCCGTLLNASGTAKVVYPLLKAGITIVDTFNG